MSTTEVKAKLVDSWVTTLSETQKRGLIIALVLLVSEQDDLSIDEVISQLEPIIKPI